ncbi:MAG: acyl carrier protein [Leptospirales bacterium]
MSNADQIIKYITDEILEDEDQVIDEQTSLFDGGVLDSLNLVTLISFLEDTHKIKIKSSEVTLENLNTVSNMINFIDKKLA